MASKRQHGRRLIPDNLPREEVVYELPEDERRCPIDGDPMPLIRYETSEQLEYEPATLKVIVHKRAVYACAQKHDEAKLITTPKPPQPIEKGRHGRFNKERVSPCSWFQNLARPVEMNPERGRSGPARGHGGRQVRPPFGGLLELPLRREMRAEARTSRLCRFGDHLPGYRLEDILSRHGVEIRRSTIYDWLAAVADLAQPLYDLMKQRVLQSKVIHADDTQVKLIDTTIGGTRLARFWAAVRRIDGATAPNC